MAENLNMVVILNNIRSSENVGSIFRTADAFGVKKIYLCGYTPSPLDRFNRKNTKLIKASLGAEEFVEWEKCENLEEVIEKNRINLKNSENYVSSLSTDKSLLAFSSARLVSLRKACSENNFQNFLIVGVEQSEDSIDYRELKKSCLASHKNNIALVFGNEVEGLSEEDLKLCDVIAEIPMQGKKESLNVAVSVGIILSSLN